METLPSYADTTPLEVEWWLPGKFAFGEVTGVAGKRGIGKGLWLADLIRRIADGDSPPDGSEATSAGTVLLCATEDDAHTAEAWRLRASGLRNLANVRDITQLNGGQFMLPESLDVLREHIYAINTGGIYAPVRSVVIDPLADVSSVKLTADTTTVRNKLMNPLRRLAQDTGAMFIVMMHTTKDSGTVAGSDAIVAAPRTVLGIARDTANPAIRVVTTIKSNSADDSHAGDLRYVIKGKGHDTHIEYVSHAAGESADDVRWIDYTAQDLAGDSGGHWSRDAGQQRIIDVLTEAAPEALRAGDIASKVQASYLTTRILLRKLKEHGDVTESHGAWTIPEVVTTAL